MKHHYKRDLFDFEIGYLVKSPCQTCEFKNQRPKCHAGCHLLDQIQTRLARGISSQSSRCEG
ncbi:MAG: hypothetical protein CSA29_01795 [Desulfobacterales bacterium]|nr:MAG: hypothetical protein CSA29_01795 [Desulfobacterales bacterium]